MFNSSNGPFLRDAIKDYFNGDKFIKKETRITAITNPNHYKQEFFQNPEVFDPDRWDNIDPSKMNPYSFFPFSSGQRTCIGQQLAVIEMKITVIHILRR